MKLSKAGFDFLHLALQDVESAAIAVRNRNGCETKRIDVAPCEPYPPSRGPVEEAERRNSIAGAQSTQPHTGVSRCLGGTNYAKWESFAKIVAESEAADCNEQTSVLKEMQPTLQGCAHDRSQERMLYEKPTVEKLLAADRFREEGNSCFRAMNYGSAAVFYRKALIQFDYAFPDTTEETEWFERSKLACHLNMAICKFKLQDWDECLAQCSSALRIDRKNSKALYRRGMVYLHLDKLKEAKEVLLAAQALSPGDPAIRSAIQELNQKIVAYRTKRRIVCNAMLGASTDEDVHDSN